MSDTPRADAAAANASQFRWNERVVPVGIARELEKLIDAEIIRLQAEIDELRAQASTATTTDETP